MRAAPLRIPGVYLLEHRVFEDSRGAFFETWNERHLREMGIQASFVQENVSVSSHHVLRGLHYQLVHPQGKLVRVISGAIFDVIVDLRRSSQTFGQFINVELRSPHSSLWIPPGLAHGFLATAAAPTTVQYLVTDYWYPAGERAIRWNDPEIGIPWPLAPDETPNLSAKDQAGVSLAMAETYP